MPLDRRHFLQHTMTALAGSAVTCAGSGAPDRPNVLFIAVDDLNDWIGCMEGHPDTRTPNMDRIAARGVTFMNAFCTAPLCNASRASLMSGLRPSTTGVYTNYQQLHEAAPDVLTVPDHFRTEGYRVMGGGKLFHSRTGFPATWDDYLDREPNPEPPVRPANGLNNVGGFDWGGLDIDDEEMYDTQLARWTAERLMQPADEPFFIGCGFFRPHLPWFAPQEYFDMFPPESVALPPVLENDLDDVPAKGQSTSKRSNWNAEVRKHGLQREGVAAYLACIAYTDRLIGLVLDALEAGPHEDNTIIVLWGDHGWHLGEKLKWGKFTLWEEATRNPLIISIPGLTPPGSRCMRTVSLLDVYPTLADLCDLTPNEKNEGISLRPWLESPAAPRDVPAVTTYGRRNHAVRTEQWRYIRYHDGGEELYDHRKDPQEYTNLAAQPEYDGIKRDLTLWLPKYDAPHAPLTETDKQKVIDRGEY